MTYITFLLLGLGTGAVFSALGTGLVLTYRSSGVINFATGAMASYVAYVFAELRTNGGYFIPIPGLPPLIHLANSVPLLPAMVLSLLTAALLGLILYVVIFRFLRNALPLAKVVASVGLMITLESVCGLRLGVEPVTVPSIFPQTVWVIGSLRVPLDRVYFAISLVAISIALWAFFRFSSFGLITRGAAESERAAVIVGISPDRVAAINWMIGSIVVGLSGILISPIVPLVPSSYTLFIVPALAAALVGQFTSLAPTVVTGLALGMLQSETTKFETFSWFPKTGVANAIPVVLIVAVLIVRGRPLPERGALISRSLPEARRPERILPTAVIGGAVLLILTFALSGQYRAGLMTTMATIVIALSWVVVTGYVGQISLVQLSLAGVAALMLSRITEQWGVPFPLSVLLAACCAVVIGVATGLPALRIRGVNLAVVTIAVAVGIESVYFNNIDLNGGVNGAEIRTPRLFGINFEIGSGTTYPRVEFALFLVVVVVISSVLVANLRRSRLGSQMLAVRANERAAAAGGISVRMIKILAFGIGASLAGVGGALLGYQAQNVSPGTFDVFVALSLFAICYLSGMTSITGAVLAGVLAPGGIFYVIFTTVLHLGRYYDLLSGLFLIDASIRNPDGIAGRLLQLGQLLSTRRDADPSTPSSPRVEATRRNPKAVTSESRS